jgi:hypothetical protein
MMKSIRHGWSHWSRLLAATIGGCFLPFTVGALDIADFLVCDQNSCPDLAGTAYYRTGAIAANGSARSSETDFELAIYGIDMAVEVRLGWELTEDRVLLHFADVFVRSEYARHDKSIDHGAPVCLLPRDIQLGTTYDCTLEDGSNTVVGQTKVGEVSVVASNYEQSSEVIQLVLFPGEDVSIILSLARDIGIMEVEVVSTFASERYNLTVDVYLDDFNPDWHDDPVLSMWSETHREGGGWRSSDWIGNFWSYCTNAPYICHTGLGWIYGVGGKDSVYVYVDGGGWLWTQEGMYPIFYSFKRGEYIYYVDVPGSNVIWGFTHGAWDILVD